MTPKDKRLFLETYQESSCLAEALEKCHVSEYAVRCECAKDETFSRKFREIAKAKARKGGRIVTDEMRRERKEKFLKAYAEGRTFMESIKIAGFSTHSFQTAKDNDREFADAYAKIARGSGTNSLRKQQKIEEYKGKTQVCIKCGRELPIVFFQYGARKSCSDCCQKRKENMYHNLEETTAIKKLRRQIDEADAMCEIHAKNLDVPKYIEASRKANVLKQKLDALLHSSKTAESGANVYHINVSNK